MVHCALVLIADAAGVAEKDCLSICVYGQGEDHGVTKLLSEDV